MTVIKFNPKDKKEMSKVYNNIYVKNFPVTYDEAYLRNQFS
jgi:hypothetical protein